MLITAQRIGAAIGIAVTGTALFAGSQGGASGQVMPQLVASRMAPLIPDLVTVYRTS